MLESRAIGEAVFSRIQREHPELTMQLRATPEHSVVELELMIPVQPSLRFEVALNLQNQGELQLNVGEFSAEWSPCTEPRMVELYLDAVRGLLSGRLRILEYWRRGRLVKAYLQKPSASEWQTMFRYHRGWAFTWMCSDVRVVQNIAG